MGKRVQTGCPNCKRCTNTAVGEGGRKTGRAFAALATGGLSEGARLATGNCRACGHKMSLHSQTTAAVAPTPGPAPSPGHAWAPDPAVQRSTVEDLDQKAAQEEAKAEEWEAKAASCDESKMTGRLQAKNARSLAAKLRKEAANKRQRAENLRALAASEDSPEPAAVEASHPLAPAHLGAPTQDLTEQLARLADLKASGVLTDDEFVAAKARLLG